MTINHGYKHIQEVRFLDPDQEWIWYWIICSLSTAYLSQEIPPPQKKFLSDLANRQTKRKNNPDRNIAFVFCLAEITQINWLRYVVGWMIRSTQSASPVSSQSTVDIEVSKPAVTSSVLDPGFENPSIDLSSIAQTTTPHSGMLRPNFCTVFHFARYRLYSWPTWSDTTAHTQNRK